MPKALEAIIDVIEFGEEKYTPAEDKGWMQYDPKEVLDSMLRHTLALVNGEILDPESGKPHAAHILFNASVYVELTSYCSSEDSSGQMSPEDSKKYSIHPSIGIVYDPHVYRPPSEPDPAS